MIGRPIKPLATSFVLLSCLLTLLIYSALTSPSYAIFVTNENTQPNSQETSLNPFSFISEPQTPPTLQNNNEPSDPPLQALKLTVMPPSIGDQEPLSAKPGKIINTTIQVRNASPETVTLYSYAQDFIIAEDEHTLIPVNQDVDNRWSLASWIIITPNVHTLAPKEIAKINVQIQVPTDALPGGHYARVLHSPQLAYSQKFDTGISTTGIKAEIGTLFYLTVEGRIQEKIFIRAFNFQKFQEFGPISYSFMLDNQSDIHQKPYMRIDIYNLFKQKLATLEPSSSNIFPQKSKHFQGNWSKFWGLGPYKATLTITYGSYGQLSQAESHFWIIPLRLIIGLLIAVLVLIAVLITARRHLQHRRVKINNGKYDFEAKLKKLKKNK